MTPDEEAAAKKKAEEEAKKKAEEDAAAAAKAAKEAADNAAAAAKKEKQFWTDAHNELKMRMDELEEDVPRPFLTVIALILAGFSALVILLAFVASFARRTPPQG